MLLFYKSKQNIFFVLFIFQEVDIKNLFVTVFFIFALLIYLFYFLSLLSLFFTPLVSFVLFCSMPFVSHL